MKAEVSHLALSHEPVPHGPLSRGRNAVTNAGILAAFFLFTTGTGTTQPTGVKTTQFTLDDGNITFSVTNVSQQPVTAMFVTAVHTDARGRFLRRVNFWRDSVIEARAFPPLNPLDSRGFKVPPHPREAKTEFAVRAVVFEDGSTSGDPEWIAMLLDRRKAAHRYLGIVLDRLRVAQNAVPPRQAFLDELEQLRDRLRSEIDFDRDILPKPEDSALDHVFDLVLVNLRRPGRPDLTWPQTIGRVESLCLQLKRELERARPPLAADH